MFPLINNDNLSCNEAYKSNANDINDYNNSKNSYQEKIWKQDRPPENIEVVYKWFIEKQKLIENKLDRLDAYYKIDDQKRFKTLNKYSIHLNRIKNFIGINELKSAKTMQEVHEFIKFNKIKYKLAMLKVKNQNEETHQDDIVLSDIKPKQLKLPPIAPKSASNDKEKSEKIENSVAEIQFVKNTSVVVPVIEEVQKDELKGDNDFSEIDEQELKDQNQSDSSNLKLNTDIRETIEDAEERIKMIKSDSVITPIIDSIRMNLIKIGPQEEYDAEVMKEVLDNTLEALHEKYPPLIEQVEELCEIFERYFLSFLITDDKNFFIKRVKNDELQIESFDINFIKPEILLNSAIKYDKRRFQFINAVRNSLKNMKTIALKFDDDTYNGISLQDLSHDGIKLAKRFETENIQVVCIIPDFSAQLKKCIRELEEWMSYDKEYSYLILDDMKEIDRRKKEMVKQKHVCENIFNQLSYRLRLLKNSIENHQTELFDLNIKNCQVQLPFQDLDAKKLSHLLEHYTDKFKVFNDGDFVNLDCKSALEKLGNELVVYENEMTKLSHLQNLTNIKTRNEKSKKLELLHSYIDEIERRIGICYEQKKVNPKELEILEKCLVKLKEIYMFKTSWEIMRKIFYDLPFPILKFGLSINQSVQLIKNEDDPDEYDYVYNKHDQLLYAMDLISDLLENDWITFYYHLPFYPERGYENKNKDIDDCLFKFSTVKHRSLFSLQKWKRFHSRAKLDDLKSTLKAISRHDILQELTEKIFNFGKRKKKKNYINEMDKRKREAENLHQKLVKFFEKRKLNA